MKNDNPRTLLLQKLFKVMKAIPELEKTGKMLNDKGEEAYSYLEKGDTLLPFRQQLIKNRIMCLPTKVEPIRWGNATALGGTCNYSEQRITFTFFDIDTAESLDCQFVGHGADALDKDSPKAATQALKYFLVNSFFVKGIELDGDSKEEQDALKELNRQYMYMEGVPVVAIDSNGTPLEHPWIEIDGGFRAFAVGKKHKTAGTLRKLSKMLSHEEVNAHGERAGDICCQRSAGGRCYEHSQPAPRVKVRAFMGSLNGNKNAQPIIDRIQIIGDDSPSMVTTGIPEAAE